MRREPRRRARQVTKGRRVGVLAAGVAWPLALACACSSGGHQAPSPTSATPSSAASPVVTVGVGDTTEQVLLQQLYVQLLERAGYDARAAAPTDRASQLKQIAAGSLSVEPDYLAGLGAYLSTTGPGTPSATPPGSPTSSAPSRSPSTSTASSGESPTPDAPGDDVTGAVAAIRPSADAAGVTLLDPAKADPVNAFVVLTSMAKAQKLTSVSDLAALGRPVALAADPSCPTSATCEPALATYYGLTISEFIPVDVVPSATATATPESTSTASGSGTETGPETTPVPVSQGSAIRQLIGAKLVDLGVLSTTDDTVSESGLTQLTDDLNTQPANNVVPVASRTLAAQPRFAKALNSLSPVLTTADLAQMAGQVDGQHLEAAQVARSYLKDKNLI